jgi:hypothetical protein
VLAGDAYPLRMTAFPSRNDKGIFMISINNGLRSHEYFNRWKFA